MEKFFQVLINGGHGIGTGWSTDVPSYNPRDIVDNLKRMMEHEVPFSLSLSLALSCILSLSLSPSLSTPPHFSSRFLPPLSPPQAIQTIYLSVSFHILSLSSPPFILSLFPSRLSCTCSMPPSLAHAHALMCVAVCHICCSAFLVCTMPPSLAHAHTLMQVMEPMHPWFRGFKGQIELNVSKKGDVSYAISGILGKVNETTLQVTELPVGKWTQQYKEFLETLLETDGGKKEPFIKVQLVTRQLTALVAVHNTHEPAVHNTHEPVVHNTHEPDFGEMSSRATKSTTQTPPSISKSTCLKKAWRRRRKWDSTRSLCSSAISPSPTCTFSTRRGRLSSTTIPSRSCASSTTCASATTTSARITWSLNIHEYQFVFFCPCMY